jgi:hypothetical protein
MVPVISGVGGKGGGDGDMLGVLVGVAVGITVDGVSGLLVDGATEVLIPVVSAELATCSQAGTSVRSGWMAMATVGGTLTDSGAGVGVEAELHPLTTRIETNPKVMVKR